MYINLAHILTINHWRKQGEIEQSKMLISRKVNVHHFKYFQHLTNASTKGSKCKQKKPKQKHLLAYRGQADVWTDRGKL